MRRIRTDVLLGKFGLWHVTFFAILGGAILTWSAHAQIAPVLKRKVVTLRAQTGEVFKVVFSAKQADPEVLYEIKTIYQPAFDARLTELDGKTETRPFDTYSRAAIRLCLNFHGWLLASWLLTALFCGGALRAFWRKKKAFGSKADGASTRSATPPQHLGGEARYWK